ncbi:MAG: hypothetical protein JOZ39_09980 [Chloroflexi bacterium]|nr:hypothetical protein [Chloroflexota bacterium]
MSTIAYPRAAPAPDSRVRARWFIGAGAAIFLGCFAAYALAGVYLLAALHITHGDGVSRTALASFVIYGRDPHLASIGFDWEPLPSFVQIPLLAILRPFGWQLFAGPLQSAAFMAGAVALLWRFFGLFPRAERTRPVLVGLFAINPMIVLYAANGLSEASLIFFIVGTVYFLLRWLEIGGYASLIGMALMTAGAFSTRYEGVALAAGGAVAIVIAALAAPRLNPPRLEAMLLTYLVPVSYAVLLWLFFNRLIMGDALFFLRGTYSNSSATSQLVTAGSPLQGVAGSLGGSLSYAATRFFGNFAAFAPVALAAVVAIATRREWRVLAVAAVCLAIPAFHVALLYSGNSFGWLRFFMYSIPAAFLVLPYLLPIAHGRAMKTALFAVLVAGFIGSDLLTGWIMDQPQLGREEYTFVDAALHRAGNPGDYRTMADERAVADYINASLPGRLVLLDTVYGYAIPLLADHPEQFAITSDRDFQQILASPTGRVDYILARAPVTSGVDLDLVNRTWPTLYGGALPWATLVHDFGGESGWRLFAVAGRAPPK